MISSRLTFVATLLFASFSINAQEIQVNDAWARPTPPIMRTAAIYLEVTNNGETIEKLLSASISPTLAKKTEFHKTVVKNEVAKMVHQKDGVKLPPKSRVTFEPGGLHIMLLGMQKPLIEGTEFEIELELTNNKKILVPVNVMNKSGKKEMDHSHHH